MFPLELAQRLREPNPPHLLDVRTKEELAEASLPAALHIPLGELIARIGELAELKEQEIVVFCHHGMRSQRAADILHQQGFTQVRNLMGGIDRWAQEVDPAMKRY